MSAPSNNKLPFCKLFYQTLVEQCIYCIFVDFHPNFRKDTYITGEIGVMVLSHFAPIGGLEIYTGEGKTHPQEVLYCGKQSAGSRPAFFLGVLSSHRPCSHTPKARGFPGQSLAILYSTLGLNLSSFPFFFSCPFAFTLGQAIPDPGLWHFGLAPL